MIDEKTKKESKKIQLRLLDELKRICEKNNITFWIDFGTLLGAVRNKKMIPWDDDIDVSMPIKDHERFLKIANKELPRDIFLQTSKTDPEYKQCMTKLCDCYSTFIHNHETGNELYHHGIYIDIFPSVYYPKMPYILRKILLYFTVRSRYKAVIDSKNVWWNYPLYFFLKFIWFLFSPFKSNKLGQIVEDNGYYYAIPDIFVYPLKDIEFEGKMYPAPNNTHEYLKIMYGENYMIPPPIDKRIAHAKKILPNTPCNHPMALHKKNV